MGGATHLQNRLRRWRKTPQQPGMLRLRFIALHLHSPQLLEERLDALRRVAVPRRYGWRHHHGRHQLGCGLRGAVPRQVTPRRSGLLLLVSEGLGS